VQGSTINFLSSFLIFLVVSFSASMAEAQVTLTDGGTSVTLNNGIIAATITKANAHVTSITYRGFQMVRPAGGDIYYSMDGGTSYEQPGSCLYSIKTQTPNLVDIALTQTYSTQIHAVDWELHYVLRTGDSGLYAYAILSHPATYPAASIGEWRNVWKFPDDLLLNIFVDDLRNWQMPTAADYAAASPTGIAEVVLLNTGVRTGKYDSKYEYSANYADLGSYGHASNTNLIGAWLVLGSHEYFNDGPTKNDLTAADRIIHQHFGMNHYNGSAINVAAGESWRKIFGPFLFYMNSCPTGANACWADAKAKAQSEQTVWPYSWLTANSEYPLTTGRGTVTGRFVVNDALKPTVSGANAWVGVAQADPGINWQYDTKHYQYWVKSDANGNFSIPNVRPGTYTLYAFTNGAVGEYSQASVAVTAGGTTALGSVTWNVTHPGGSIAWEIGVPDRTAKEFRHGSTDYFEPYKWDLYGTEFPNPLNYYVGTSNWAVDWNYAHSPYPSTLVTWPWRINFNLASVPASGNATMTFAFASSDHSRMDVYVNDDVTLFASFYPNEGGGNALIREGIHAKYGLNYLAIPVSRLRVGANTITLVEGRTADGIQDHFMYDYVNLEMPGAATPDFSVSATPSSQIVAPGASAPYTVTVTPSAGFTGTVTFSVSGLPSGATAAFNPTSVTTSGSTTMTVATSASTPAGSYPLTVTATSGALVHTAGVTLVVQAAGGGDFSVAATPASLTIASGDPANYTVTTTATGGFAGTITFAVTGVPPGMTASFSPATVVGSGSTTLSLTGDNPTAGTYTLTITGTNGSVTRSTTVTITISG
jgi:rhamnogalacturonan endolyase